jgi:hypothetical protein
MLQVSRLAFAALLVTACASRAPVAPPAPTPATTVAPQPAPSPAPSPAPTPASEGVHGVLVLPPGVNEPTGGDVFLTVYAPNQDRWYAIAAAKIPVTAWPLPFDVGAEQQMVGSRPIEGRVRIRAWIDHDGDVCTFQKGDREGELETVAPASGLSIPLEKLHDVDVPNRCGS